MPLSLKEIRERRVQLDRQLQEANRLAREAKAALRILRAECTHPAQHRTERVIAFIPGDVRCGLCGEDLGKGAMR